MHRFSTARLVAILAASASLASVTTGSAQPTPPSPTSVTSSMNTSSTSAGSSQGRASAQIERHIKKLRIQLSITSVEQPQWEQFAQVIRDNAARMTSILMARSSAAGIMGAEDNMQSYAQLAQVHATNMQNLASAFQTLYMSFTAQQRQLADSVFQKSAEPVVSHRGGRGVSDHQTP